MHPAPPRSPRFTRRRVLLGSAAAAGLAVLTACGDTASAPTTPATGASTGSATQPPIATQAPAATTPPVVPGTVAPAPTVPGTTGMVVPMATTAPAAMTGTTTVTWFASRDTTGYTPKAVAAYNAGPARIKIDYQEQGGTTDDLRDKFTLVASAKDAAADLVSTDISYLPGYAAGGWMVPLDDAFPAGERAAFFKGTLDGVTYGGKLVSIPWFNNGPGLFYRKDLLDAAALKPPTTYDDLVTTAKKLQTPEITGFVFQAPQNEGGIINWMEHLWGYGGDIIDDKGVVVVDKGTAAVDGLQRLVDYVYKDKIAPETVLGMKLASDATTPFVAGNAVFLWQWMSQVSFLDADASKIKGKWDVVALPSKDGTKPGPGCLGTWNIGVSAFSRKQKEAIEALRWVVSQDTQKARYLGNGNLPTRIAVLDDADIKAKYPFVDKLKPSFDNLKPRPVSPYYGQMSTEAIQPAFGVAMARQKTPDQAIKEMADKLRQIVKS